MSQLSEMSSPIAPMILHASDPEFSRLYPYGANVHDRFGRRLPQVVWCNPLTGEVDRVWITRNPLLLLPSLLGLRLKPRSFMGWYEYQVSHRHGFWPAPLTITPRTCDEAARGC